MKKTSAVLVSLLVWTGSFSAAQASQHALETNVSSQDGTVFFITTEDGKTVRRPYTSAGAFLSYSFNSWNSVEAASPEDMALPVGDFVKPQEGKVFCSDRGSDKGTCYLITSGQRAGFTSAEVFYGLGYTFDRALSGDVSFLAPAADIGSAGTAHQPGTLVNKNGTIYLIAKDGLVGVPNPATLKSWGYDFADVVPANSADANASSAQVLPDRKPEQVDILIKTVISTSTAPSLQHNTVLTAPTVTTTTPVSQSRVGYLVNKDGTVYLVGDNGLLGIPDMTIFNSWCLSFSSVIPANQAEKGLSQVGVLPMRTVGQVLPPGVSSLNVAHCDASGMPPASPAAGSNVPSASGTSTSTSASASTSTSASAKATLTITPDTLPAATTGQPYSVQLQITGGTAPYTWNTVSTTYPTGCCVLGLVGYEGSVITFNTQSGDVVMNTATGVFQWTVRVTDSQGNSATKVISLTIQPGAGASSGGGSSSPAAPPVSTDTPPPATDTPPAAPRVGQLVNRNSAVVFVGNGGIYGIPDLTTFNSWGFDFSQAHPANSSEQALPQIGVIPMKQPGCSSPLEQIAGSCGN